MKKYKIMYWVATIIIAGWEGLMPLATILFAPEYATTGTRALFYPDYFAYALIVCKVLGVIAIISPRTPQRLREWAYAGLCFVLIFAAISHFSVDGNPGFVLMPLVFLAILMLSYFSYYKLKEKTPQKLSLEQAV